MAAPFAMFKPSDDSTTGPEFASAVFGSYHLDGRLPGSSPNSRSYWLLGVFVYLTRNLASEKSFQRAIADMVSCGKLEGSTHFDAIMTSITHVILVRVTEDCVEHTKRLRVLGADLSSDYDAEEPGYYSDAKGEEIHDEAELDEDQLSDEKGDDVGLEEFVVE
jgi:hypothetical protein